MANDKELHYGIRADTSSFDSSIDRSRQRIDSLKREAGNIGVGASSNTQTSNNNISPATRAMWGDILRQMRDAFGITSRRGSSLFNNANLGNSGYFNKNLGLSGKAPSEVGQANSVIKENTVSLKKLSDSLRKIANISSTAVSRGHITATQQADYLGNRSHILQAASPSAILDTQSKLANQRLALGGLLDERAQTPKGTQEYQGLSLQIKQAQTYVKTLSEAVDTMKEASSSVNTFDDSLKDVKQDAARGSFMYNLQQRGFAIGARMAGTAINGVSNFRSTGQQVDLATGQQALQIGYLTGNRNDSELRKAYQGNSAKYGYSNQETLGFYQQAIRSGGNVSQSEADKRVANIMSAGRDSNLSSSTYNGLVTALAGGNTLNKSSDIKDIVKTVIAANAMSGNKGNYEQNTQTLTNLLAQLSSNGSVSKEQTKNLANTTSYLSSTSKEFQGDSGANAAKTMNSAYLSASQGKNPALLYTIMRQQRLTGASGILQARLIAQKGVSSPKTIEALQSMFGNEAKNGKDGHAMATVGIQNITNLSASQADALATDIGEGKLTPEQISKHLEELDKKKKKTPKSKYNKSVYGSITKKNAKTENNKTGVQDSTNWLTDIAGGIANMGPWGQLGALALGGTGLDLLKSGTGALFKSGLNLFGKTKFGKALGLSTGKHAVESKGLFSSITDGAKSLFSVGKHGTESKGIFSPIVDGAKSLFGVGESAAKSGAKGTGIFSKITGGVSKFFTTGSLLSKLGLGALGLQGSIPDSRKLSKSETDKLTSMYGYDKNGKKSKSSGKKTTLSGLSEKKKQQLVDQEKSVVAARAKYIKDYQKLLNEEENLPKSGHHSKGSKSHKAMGGRVTSATEIAEENKMEWVVPSDPAKTGRTQSIVNDIANTTGIRASKYQGVAVTKNGDFKPSVNIVVNGNTSADTLEAIKQHVTEALGNATDNYRRNLRHA